VIGGVNGILGRLPAGAAVVVIRLRSMGDTVLTTPALHLLKRARPDLRIFVVVEQCWGRLLESNPDIDGLIPTALRAIRRERPVLCLNFHGGPTSAWLTALSGARWRAGFGHFSFQPVYNVRIPRAQEILRRATDAPVHTAEHLASAMFYLGVEQQEIPRARLFVTPVRRPRPYAVLHIGAAEASKQWPPERFLEIAHWLRDKEALEPILVAGPGERTPPAGDLPTLNDLSLGQLMGLLAGAELFIGNDSGPAHVAAAFGVPCVVVFGSSNSKTWYPWRTAHRVVESPQGISAVQLEAVQQAALDLIRTMVHD
jgi:heptosyltransferase-3